MAMIPSAALSISHFIDSVGADAGFASIIGLAILVFLFFAQMRETATLRERAEQDAERLRQVEGRLGQVLRSQAAQAAQAGRPAQPAQAGRPAAAVRPLVPGQAPVPVPAGAQRVAPAPMPRIAPAGVAAPALTAATRLIPVAEPAAQGATATATPPATGLQPASATPPATGFPPAPGGPPPGSGNGGEVAPAPATVAGGNGAARLGAPLPRVQLGEPGDGGRRDLPPLRELEPEASPSPARRIVFAAVAVVVVVAIVIGLLSLTSSGNSTPKHRGTKSARTHRRGSTTVSPRSVSVAVLNGTGTFHVASDIATRLQGLGFKRGAKPTNAPAQTHTTTIVQYLSGHRADALVVAKALHLGASRVSKVDSSSLLAACPQSGACPVDVIVTVGSDLAATASASTTQSTGAPATGTSAAPGAVSTTTP